MKTSLASNAKSAVVPPAEGPSRRAGGRPRLDAQMVPRVLDAAERLFADQEALNISIRDIAAEAGLPHSAIYRYFASKDDIFRAVLERGRDRQRADDDRRRAAGTGARGAIGWIMEHNRSYARAVARVALSGGTPSSLGLEAEMEAGRRSVKELTEHVTRSGGLGDLDPAIVVAAATAMTIGWVASEEWIVEATGLGDLDRERVRARIDEVMDTIVAAAFGVPVSGDAAKGTRDTKDATTESET